MIENFYKSLEWEDIHGDFSMVEHGALDRLVEKLNISRDDNLKLKIEAEGKIHNRQQNTITFKKNPNTKHGNIYSTSEIPIVKIKAGFGITGEITGARIEPKEKIQEGSVFQGYLPDQVIINFNNSEQRTSCWLTEWLVNVETSHSFPSLTDKKINLAVSISRDGQLINKKCDVSRGEGFDHVELKLKTFPRAKVIFGKILERLPQQKGMLPGFISYQIIDNNIPTESYRNQIREALSFALGRPIGCLGYTTYDKNWETVQTCAINPKLPFDSKKCFKEHSFPPTQLAETIIPNPGSTIESDILSRIINGFLENHKKYDLGYKIWLYWHALFASPAISPLLFFAIIDNITTKYHSSNKPRINIKLPPKIWDKLRNELLVVIKKHNVLNEKGFEKIGDFIKSNANNSSITDSIELFMEKQNLMISELEKEAMNSRNDPAHGRLIENPIIAIEHSRVLRILCNRILLKITNGSDCYIDYHVPRNNCIKDISQAIGYIKSEEK